jgi:gliding motility-associated transport system ATP-binding protein
LTPAAVTPDPVSIDESSTRVYMIDVQQITKRYGQHTAIDRVTFSVAKGEVLAFLGPNGAGKTTTMRILTCFMPATEGTATVAGYDCLEQPLEVKRRIGYLPETPPVYLELTVDEYLRFVGRLRGLTGGMLTSAMSREIDRLGLGSVQHRLIGNLSRGYRQRVGLAQALIHDPPILILDEPTVGLDPKQIIEIRELIKSLAGSHSVILSTHILPEATAVCQRVVIISGGRIVAEDTPDRLSARLRHSEKIALTLTRAPADAEARLRQLDGVLHVHGNGPSGHFLLESQLGKDIREDIARLAVNNDWGLIELKLISMTLEDVFLQLTHREEGFSLGSGEAAASGSPATLTSVDRMDPPS